MELYDSKIKDEKRKALIDRIRFQHEGFNKEVERQIRMCAETDKTLNDTIKEFNSLTSIFNKTDLTILLISCVLQGAMKYCIKKCRDLNDSKLARRTPGHTEEHSNRNKKYYYASIDEIISNPVPFDAIRKQHEEKWYIDRNINIPRFSGVNHRFTALGHDPILGLVIGTANIMTATITRYDFRSWHINTMVHTKLMSNGDFSNIKMDTICERASTLSMFNHVIGRIKKEGTSGWIALGCALLKEIVHLTSDVVTRQSLPIPIVSVFSPKLSQTLSLYGINTGTLIEGAMGTKIINWGTAYIHRLCMPQGYNEELYMARTNKILMYSNMIATYSDIAYTLFLAYSGDRNALRKFDLGGSVVTMSQICDSQSVITKIEMEFITNQILQQLKKN